jgi:glyoxylase-like metal-dependent hydrolase (beta-lactamase superfamily II)
MKRAGVGRVIPLTFGWERLPKSISVHGADPAVRLREPVPGVLLELDGGWLLLDVGFKDALVLDSAWQARRGSDFETELVRSGDSLVAAFEMVGIDPDDVVTVAVSHLHYDHAGGLRHFADHVPVYAQRAELRYISSTPDVELERHGLFRSDFGDPRIPWQPIDGDQEIVPGVTALWTGGHTPGHQSFLVDVDERHGGGGYVFAFDAADLQENIDDESPVGTTIGIDPEATVDSIRRLKTVAAERGYRLIPGHDPEVWPALTAALGVPGPH